MEKKRSGKKGLRVEKRKDEPIEILLRRFKKRVIKEGIMQDLKKHNSYEKPGAKKRREKKQNRKNWLKHQQELHEEFE